jgi:hypothetical protein
MCFPKRECIFGLIPVILVGVGGSGVFATSHQCLCGSYHLLNVPVEDGLCILGLLLPVLIILCAISLSHVYCMCGRGCISHVAVYVSSTLGTMFLGRYIACLTT